MKKLMICASAIFILPVAAITQQLKIGQQGDSSVMNIGKHVYYSNVIPISQMDQRMIYNWGNGQRSTPTGRQAGRTNVDYAKVMGDSAVVVYNPPASLRAGAGRGRTKRSASRFNSNAGVVPISQMDQRMIYNWANGQRSTPTGRQANRDNVKYARVFGDSAVVVQKSNY